MLETKKRVDLINENEKIIKTFDDVIKSVQDYLINNFSELILENKSDFIVNQLKTVTKKYLSENKLGILNTSQDELVDRLYSDLFEFSFLTEYIYRNDIEEININSWEDIEVIYSNGKCIKTIEKFKSPRDAMNIVRRMLYMSSMIIDNANPIVTGSITKSIRIASMIPPVVDEEIGVTASIRIVKSKNLKKEDFINQGTATEEMMDFLVNVTRCGVSSCIAGGTGSGKTTFLNWLLSKVCVGKRIFTIESGSREFDFIQKDEDGNVITSVIHTLTRPSDNPNLNIDQNDLLVISLRYHPDMIIVGEMRDKEAYSAQECANTGHTVLSTVHASSCIDTINRIILLCKKATDIDEKTVREFVVSAFPVIVYVKQLENKERKIMEIMEIEKLGNYKYNYKTLFRYKITENKIVNGKIVINGYHEKVDSISENMKKRLMENGMTLDILETL